MIWAASRGTCCMYTQLPAVVYCVKETIYFNMKDEVIHIQWNEHSWYIFRHFINKDNPYGIYKIFHFIIHITQTGRRNIKSVQWLR